MALRKDVYLKAKEASRYLRKNPTEAEKRVWKIIRKGQINGYKFLRQHPLFFDHNNVPRFFISDFYCAKLKLVLEIDGDIHKSQFEYDKIRDNVLKDMGISVIRFMNDETINARIFIEKLEEKIDRIKL